MTAIPYDLHVHTTYSDGAPMAEMAAAAAAAGLEGVGFADHCVPFADPVGRRERFDLAETYERRRADIEALGEQVDLRLFDAVEVSYHPDHEDDIRAFLERADVDYAIGSVHFAGDLDFTSAAAFADADEAARRDAVDRYFDWQVAMIDSGLFDVVGHLDVVERLPPLRSLPTERHYDRIADALAGATAVPEINAGRADREYGTVHPRPTAIDRLRDRGVAFTVGTDAHRPGEIGARLAHLDAAGLAPDTYPV